MKLRPSPSDALLVDDLTFAVRWSARRRTVGLSVRRGGELRVAAPVGMGARPLEAIVRDKLPWVRRKLAELEALEVTAPCHYVDGERLPYLGRTYRMTAVDHPPRPVALRHGRLEIDQALDGETRDAVLDWYLARARARLPARVAALAPHVNAAPDEVVVRDIGKTRWGVCNCRRRRLSLHWQLVTLPPDLLDYVVVHELAHLHEPNHGPAFWAHVARVLPDWKDRRLRLARRRHHRLD